MTTSHDGDLQTFDEALGFTVQQYLFAHGVTRVELGKLLHVPGPSISNRLRGRIRWSAEDVAVVAARFGVGSSDLMPVLGADGRWVPAPFNPGYSASASMGATPASAGAASSHLRESNSRPIHYEFQEICQTGAPSDPQLRFCPQDLLIAFILIRALTHRLYFLLALPATPAYAVTPALPLLPAISAFLLPRRGEELENGKFSTHHKELNG